MSMFRFPSMKQVFSGLFSGKNKNRKKETRHLALDTLEDRVLLTVSPSSAGSYMVNQFPVYEPTSRLIEQLDDLRDNNYVIDYDMGGDDDGDIVVAWERADVIYEKTGTVVISGQTVDTYSAKIDAKTLQPELDWNIYARYLTNEVQRVTLDPSLYSTASNGGSYNNISLYYGAVDEVNNQTNSGLIYKITLDTGYEALTTTQDNIEFSLKFMVQGTDGTVKSTLIDFTENSGITIATGKNGTLDYTYSMEQNAQKIQTALQGMGEQYESTNFLRNCVVTAQSPTEFYIQIVSEEDLAAVVSSDGKTLEQFTAPKIYIEQSDTGVREGFELSANVEVVRTAVSYNNVVIDPSKPLETANNIAAKINSYNSVSSTGVTQTAVPSRVQNQIKLVEGPTMEPDLIYSSGIYPEVTVTPVFGLVDANGNSLDGYVYDITYTGNSAYIDHPALQVFEHNSGTGALENSATNGTETKITTVKQSSQEFRVNDEEPDNKYSGQSERYDQLNPSVAMDADGDFVITWEGEVNDTTHAGNSRDIYAKTYSARNYVGNTADEQTMVDAWLTAYESGNWDSLSAELKKVFEDNGFMINTVTTYSYQSANPATGQAAYYKLNVNSELVQSVNSTSDQMRVNTNTTNKQHNPDVAMDLEGNFVIVWESEGQNQSYFNGIYMQRYDRNGLKIGNETRVDTETTAANVNPSVAASDDGVFAVAWEHTTDPNLNLQFSYYTNSTEYFEEYYKSNYNYNSWIQVAVFASVDKVSDQIGNTLDFGSAANTWAKNPTLAFDSYNDLLIGWDSMQADVNEMGTFETSARAAFYKVTKADGAETYTITPIIAEFRVNSGSLTADNEIRAWANTVNMGQVGLDADGDIIVTYSGYGADISVNALIPYLSGLSMTSTNAYVQFLNEMRSLLKSQSEILHATLGVGEEATYADLFNYFDPGAVSRNYGDGGNGGDKFDTKVYTNPDQGTYITFYHADTDTTFYCHGDVDSVIAMVVYNAELVMQDRYPALDSRTKDIILGALKSVLESQLGFLRGESQGAMFTQIDAANLYKDGYEASQILSTENVVNEQREGTNSIYSISLDRTSYQYWNSVQFRVTNDATGTFQTITVDLTGVYYDLLNDGLLTMQPWEAADAIEQAIEAAIAVVGSEWSNGNNQDVLVDGLIMEGPVEVRYVDWDEALQRGFKWPNGGSDSVAALDYSLIQQFATQFSAELGIVVTNMDTLVQYLVAYLNTYENAGLPDTTTRADLIELFTNERPLHENGTVTRGDITQSLPAMFEILYQGSVHDQSMTMSWVNGELRRTEIQRVWFNNPQAGRYAIQVGGQPAITADNISQYTIVLDPTDPEGSAQNLQNMLDTLGYPNAIVTVDYTVLPGTLAFIVTFAGQSGTNIGQITFVADYPVKENTTPPADWLTNGRASTTRNGGVFNRVAYPISEYYKGDPGTAQTDTRIAVTPEGDFLVSYLQQERYTDTSYSNTNIFIRNFDESTDTAGPLVTEVGAQSETITETNNQIKHGVDYLVVTFNEEMMVSNADKTMRNSYDAKWTNSVTNPENWILTKDGNIVTNGVYKIVYGMNMAYELGLAEYGSNKWEAVIYFSDTTGERLGAGLYESADYQIIAKKEMMDKKGNYLNMTGENPYGSDETFDFSVVLFGDQKIVNEGEFEDGAQFFTDEDKTGQAMLEVSPQSNAMDGQGNSVTVWISETTDNAGNKVQELVARIDYVKCINEQGEVAVTGSKFIRLLPDSFTADSQDADCIKYASVAMQANGDFVVTWSQKNSNELGFVGDNTGWDVYARRFTLAGEAVDNVTLINDTTEGDQCYSTVAVSDTGAYVITWQSNNEKGERNQTDGWDIYASQFDKDGRSIDQTHEVQQISFSSNIQHGKLQLAYQRYNDATMKYDNYVGMTLAFEGEKINVLDDYGTVKSTFDNSATGMSKALKYSMLNLRLTSAGANDYTLSLETEVYSSGSNTYNIKFVSETYNGVYKELFRVEQSSINTVEMLYNDTPSMDERSQVLDYTTVVPTSSTTTQGNNGEFLVNSNYCVEKSHNEIQTLDFKGLYTLYNLKSFQLSFSYVDKDGITHTCTTKRIGIQDKYAEYTKAPEFWGRQEYMNWIEEQVVAELASAKDADGNTSGLEIINVEQGAYTLQMEFGGDLEGFNVTQLKIFNILACDESYTSPTITISTSQDGFNGGIIEVGSYEDAIGYENSFIDLESDDQMFPSIGMNSTGDFVITWTSSKGLSEGNIYARQYQPNGQTIVMGNITEKFDGNNKVSTVAMDQAGDYVITWTNEKDGVSNIMAQRFALIKAQYLGQDTNFVMGAADDATNTDNTNNTDNTDDTVASTTTKTYVQEIMSRNSVGYSFDYKGALILFNQYRTVEADGAAGTTETTEWINPMDIMEKALGDAFVVSTVSTAGVQQLSRVSMDNDGNFVIVWESEIEKPNAEEGDDFYYEVYAQRYASNTKKYLDMTSKEYQTSGANGEIGSEIRVGDKDYTYDRDRFPSVAMSGNGDILISWTRFYAEEGPNYESTNRSDIYQIRYNVDEDETGPTVTAVQGVYSTYKVEYETNPDGTIKTDEFGNKIVKYEYNDDGTVKTDEFGNKIPVYELDENGNRILTTYNTQNIADGDIINPTTEAIIVGFSEQMREDGAESVLNPGNWTINRINPVDGTKQPVGIKEIIPRAGSVYDDGAGRNEYVVILEDGSLLNGYEYEMILSDQMTDYAKNPLNGGYSEWNTSGTNGKYGGTTAGDYQVNFYSGYVDRTNEGIIDDNFNDFDYRDYLDVGDTVANLGTTEGIQENSATAIDQFGNYIVVWETDIIPEDLGSSDSYQKENLTRELYENNQLVSRYEEGVEEGTNAFKRIQAQMYNANGEKVGSEFTVSLLEYAHQCSPDVAMDDNGNIIVTWTEVRDTVNNSTGDYLPDTEAAAERIVLDPYYDGSAIMAVRYTLSRDTDNLATSITQVGDVFQADEEEIGIQRNSSVAFDSTTGNFVIAWENYDNQTKDEWLSALNRYENGSVDRNGIYARVYSFSQNQRTPVRLNSVTGDNSPFLVNSADLIVQSGVDIAMENGVLFAVWQTIENNKSVIYGKQYNLSSSGLITYESNQFAVSGTTTYNRSMASVSMDSAGNAVVCWTSSVQDGSEYGVYAKTYTLNTANKTLAASSGEFLVNTRTFDKQMQGQVSLGDNGHCVITWASNGQENSQRYDYGVYGKLYSNIFQDINTYATLKDVQVNVQMYGSQYQPAVAMNDSGDFVVTWTGPGRLLDNYVDSVGIINTNIAGGDNNTGNTNNTNGTTTSTANAESGTTSGVTNTLDNILENLTFTSGSNHISVLDYTDIYRRLFKNQFPKTTIDNNTSDTEQTPSKPLTPNTTTEDKQTDYAATADLIIRSNPDGTWTVEQNGLSVTSETIDKNNLKLDGAGKNIVLYGSLNADTLTFNDAGGCTFTNSAQKLEIINAGSITVVGNGGSDTATFAASCLGAGVKGALSVNGSMVSFANAADSSKYVAVKDFANVTAAGAQDDSLTLSDTADGSSTTIVDGQLTYVTPTQTVKATGFTKVTMDTTNANSRLYLNATASASNALVALNAETGSFIVDQTLAGGTVHYNYDFNGFQIISSSLKSLSQGLNINVTEANSVTEVYENTVNYYSDSKKIWKLDYSGNVGIMATDEGVQGKVQMYDSTGADTFTFDASTGTGVMTLASGATKTVIGVQNVEAKVVQGGFDKATFTDSASDDTVTMAQKYMNMSGNGYTVTTNGFTYNTAIAVNGGSDTATMNDSKNTSNDTLEIVRTETGTVATMTATLNTTYANTPKTYLNTAKGFEVVNATSANGVDTAVIDDYTSDSASAYYINVKNVDNVNKVVSGLSATDFSVSTTGFTSVSLGADDVVRHNGTVTIDANVTKAQTVYLEKNAAKLSFGGSTVVMNGANITATSDISRSDTVYYTGNDAAESVSATQRVGNLKVTVTPTADASSGVVAFNSFRNVKLFGMDDKDTAAVSYQGSLGKTTTVDSYYNSLTISGKNSLEIQGTLKQMKVDFSGSDGTRTARLYDSAIGDLFKADTNNESVLVETTDSKATNTRELVGFDMISAYGNKDKDTKTVDDVLTPWDDWSKTDSWFNGGGTK